MRVAVGSDHAGFELKELLAEHLRAAGHDVVDVGTHGPDSVDYPDFGAAVGRAVTTGDGTPDGRPARFGVAVCGSGIGICIAANKVQGVRAATVHDVTSARLSREHNDANVFCVGERFIGPQVALDALDAFLAADFSDANEPDGRHARRVGKITTLDAALHSAD